MDAKQAAGVATRAVAITALTEDAAVAIFVAKHSHSARDSLARELAAKYSITSKSVRGSSAPLSLVRARARIPPRAHSPPPRSCASRARLPSGRVEVAPVGCCEWQCQGPRAPCNAPLCKGGAVLTLLSAAVFSPRHMEHAHVGLGDTSALVASRHAILHRIARLRLVPSPGSDNGRGRLQKMRRHQAPWPSYRLSRC
jgi:hypothetical protein